MPIHYRYSDLVRRLSFARSLGKEIKEGNRCAVVVGVALNLKPRKEIHETSMRDLSSSTAYTVKHAVVSALFPSHDERIKQPPMPFMEKFYVRAQQLANHIAYTFGPPDIRCSGATAVHSKKLQGLTGVIFLTHCWASRADGDHIDLWNGKNLEIESNYPLPAQIAMIAKARECWFWKVT
jgi:Type VI secretion system (T6SS), amidase effector protein 4